MVCLALLGCVPSGAPDDLELELDRTADPFTMSWADEAPVHELSVGRCDGDCTCEDGQLVFIARETVWEAGFSRVASGDIRAWDVSPELVPPVTFGDLSAKGNDVSSPALPLEEGQLHAVVISRWVSDDVNDEAGVLAASGCATFVH